MSTAEQAWQERLASTDPQKLRDVFMFAYRRALEDAADALATEADTHEADTPYWEGLGDGYRGAAAMVRYRAAAVGTKDGDDEAPHVHQWRTFRPYNQPAYQSCAGCGNVIPAPKDDR